MQFQKRHLLLIIAVGCLILYFYGSENIPYLEHLATAGGFFYALNTLVSYTKQPQHEQLSTSQSKPKYDKSTDAR